MTCHVTPGLKMAFSTAVPVVFWGSKPLSHEITCICVCDGANYFATGSKTGHICMWKVDREDKDHPMMIPHMLLFAESTEMVSLSSVRPSRGEHSKLASLASCGSVRIWDAKEKACLRHRSLPGRLHSMSVFERWSHNTPLLAVYGQQSDILLLDSTTLESIYVLKSDHAPNWIDHVCFLPNVEHKDALLAITADGNIKVWCLHSGRMPQVEEALIEESSKGFDLKNVLSLSATTSRGFSRVLAITPYLWKVFDATGGHLKPICSQEEEKPHWRGGTFITLEIILIWKEDGSGVMYRLPRVTLGSMPSDSAYQLTSRLVVSEGLQLEGGGTVVRGGEMPLCVLHRDDGSQDCVISGDKTGRVFLWPVQAGMCNVDMYPPASSSSTTALPREDTSPPLPPPRPRPPSSPSAGRVGSPVELLQISDLLATELPPLDPAPSLAPPPTDPPVIAPLTTAAFSDSWTSLQGGTCLSDLLFPGNQRPMMTCAVHLDAIGRLVCGHDNGTIIMFYPAQVATILLLSPRRLPNGWPQYCIMKGHVGKVTHLLYPHTLDDHYDNNLLLSGGEDFSVRLWNLYSGTLLHTFVPHAGPVQDLCALPRTVSHRYQECVCSVGVDHSVAILSLPDYKCVFLASSHQSPVTEVKWRPAEDFLLVACEDGTLYVWQMETRTLDRHVDGVSAAAILLESTASPRLEEPREVQALRVVNLHPHPSDPVVQVLLFNPQTVISLLSKADQLHGQQDQDQQRKMAVGFRQYIQGRRQGLDDMGKEIHGRNVASERAEQLQEEWSQQIIHIVRLLLSCLHAWYADAEVDRDVEARAGLLRPVRPVSFGMCSRKEAFSLVLPGWGIRSGTATAQASETRPQASETRPPQVSEPRPLQVSEPRPLQAMEPRPQASEPRPLQAMEPRLLVSPLPSRSIQLVPHSQLNLEAIQLQRWGLSRLLTTQHLLAVVAIANTLMNHIKGAEILSDTAWAGDSLSEDSEDDELEGDSLQTKDNLLRASWSRVTALHCVMLPERQGRGFKPPNLTLLAERYTDKCLEIREAAQAILLSELRRIGPQGRQELTAYWSTKLPAHSSHLPRSPSSSLDDGMLHGDHAPSSSSPLQQYTALVILGVVGAEFCRHGHGKSGDSEVMDVGVARQVARALQSVILEKPKPSLSLGTSWRRSAVDLMGKGFSLWSKYVSAPRIIMALLELCQLKPLSKGAGLVSVGARMMANTSRKSLSLMTIAEPSLVIGALSQEVLTNLQASHVMHYPHSTLHPLPVGIVTPAPTLGISTVGVELLLRSKPDLMMLMETALDKCNQEAAILLVEVVDIQLFCLSAEQLKKERNLMDLVPSLRKFANNVCFSPKSRKLAVGSKPGRIHIYDFKHFHCDSVNAHSAAVTALAMSDDGKLLASLAHGDSTLKVWQVGSTMMLSVLRTPPKCIHSWPVISSQPSQGAGLRLEWAGKSVILHSASGLQHKYSF